MEDTVAPDKAVPSLAPGTAVLYLGLHDQWHEADMAGGALFEFAHEVDGPLRPDGKRAWTKGQAVSVEDLRHLRGGPDGKLHIGGADGPLVSVVKQKRPWPGVVREESGGLVIDVAHPCGYVTLHFPLATVKHDPTGTLQHSYHLPTEANP